MMNFSMPPRPTGNSEDDITKMWSYLFQLAERLNIMTSEDGKLVIEENSTKGDG